MVAPSSSRTFPECRSSLACEAGNEATNHEITQDQDSQAIPSLNRSFNVEDWVLAESTCSELDSTVHELILVRLREIFKKIFDLIPGSDVPTPLPVPLSLQEGLQPRDMVPVTRRLVRLCLQWVNFLMSYTLVDWKDEIGADDYTYIPQLFMREDATDEHMSSIMQVMTASAQSVQMRKELGMNGSYFGHCIRSVLGRSSSAWKTVSDLDDVHKGNLAPFTVIVPISDEGTMDNLERRSLFSRAFNLTAIQLISRHYKSQGWALDRTLSAEDAHVPLDERLFLFGVCYNSVELCVYINYPVLLSLDGGFRWSMWNERFSIIRYYRDKSPAVYGGLQLFLALATIEQHMRVLENLLSS
ncbi:hypothetical protein CERSUDRAFT_117054 [Gelatoporia subvermispora B]|uniref:Uncharacterized protein n=1 Tax=Ceriporiopsis subvermispora (strain B) TaxID=914234 RepID=M2QCU9_CERS8|nr:hypothetical protein CERSUDRAFT_117054 [Gelatoporia subvermispora B]